LRRRHRGHIGLTRTGRAWRRHAGTKLAQPLLKLAIAVLQFLVLAGELAQLVLKPLDTHLGIRIIRLRECLRRPRKLRRERNSASQFQKMG
jgi:hypothetical protein